MRETLSQGKYRSRINLAIFGSGTMAEIYASIVNEIPFVRLVGFVTGSSSRAEELMKKYSCDAVENRDYRAMFARHSIDAVIIATSEWVRIEPVKAAVEAGVHILLEKPYANSWSSANKLNTILSRHEYIFDVCHVLRFSPRFNEARRQLSALDGGIRKPKYIHARRNSNASRVGRVMSKTNLCYWLLPHDLDLVSWFCESSVEAAFARTGGCDGNIQDYISVSLRLANGCSVVIENIWCQPPISNNSRDFLFDIFGTEGVIEIDDYNQNVRFYGADNSVHSPDTYEHFKINHQYYGFFRHKIDDFLWNILTGQRYSNNSTEMLELMRTCEMVSQSIITGKEILRDHVK